MNPYHPKKYYQGLSPSAKTRRNREIKKHSSLSWKNPKAYSPFKTDTLVKTKSSSYTLKWKSKFPNATSLQAKSKASGVPLKFLEEVYNRGLAAWRTGHRPGATQQQWGYARVHSFLLCGKTVSTADSDIQKDAIKHSKSAKDWWMSQAC